VGNIDPYLFSFQTLPGNERTIKTLDGTLIKHELNAIQTRKESFNHKRFSITE
jgi:hypothetical protein